MRTARSSGSGMAKGTPDSRMRAFARLIRCAIVASGTRNARAISAVVRPPTARSVSGIADPGVSDGWQHRNRRTSESSSSTTDDGDVRSCTATTCSRFARARFDRHASTSRRVALRVSQPCGCSGIPVRGQRSAAAMSASWTASSAASKSPYRRASVPRTRGASSRSRSSISRCVVSVGHRRSGRTRPSPPASTGRRP